jgi:hypothetical protein
VGSFYRQKAFKSFIFYIETRSFNNETFKGRQLARSLLIGFSYKKLLYKKQDAGIKTRLLVDVKSAFNFELSSSLSKDVTQLPKSKRFLQNQTLHD